MNSVIEYNSENIDSLVFPESEINELIRDYIIPMIKYGASIYIKNAETKLIILKINAHLIPVTITEENQYGSYIFSFYTAFNYCIYEEIKNSIHSKIKLYPMLFLIKLNSLLMKFAKINKCIIINNWLFSTNIHPEISYEELKDVSEYFCNQYKGYTIIVKSLNILTTFSTIKKYIKLGYQFISLRPIYLLTPEIFDNLNKKQRRELRNDKHYINKNELMVVYTLHDFDRIHQYKIIKSYYDDLYIKKYSKYNAQFTDKFFADRLKSNCFKKIFVLRGENILAFSICFSINNTLSTPVLGYVKDIPDLYRVTSYCIQDYAISNKFIDHASSGVGHFKQSRGYKPYTEYMAYLPFSCVNYLNLSIWKLIAWISENIFVKIAKKNHFL